MPSIPAVSPAAFISLISFALLAAVIIQGPLGLKSAFTGSPSIEGSSQASGVSLTSLLDLLSARLPRGLGPTRDEDFPSGVPNSFNNLPQMAGQGSRNTKGEHDQWSWFANSRKYFQLSNAGHMQRPERVYNIASGRHAQPNNPEYPSNGPHRNKNDNVMADKLAFSGLPPLLQSERISARNIAIGWKLMIRDSLSDLPKRSDILF
jgi:hypothetical protein